MRSADKDIAPPFRDVSAANKFRRGEIADELDKELLWQTFNERRL